MTGGRRPVPEAPVYAFEKKEAPEPDAYLWEPIEAFIERMREQYSDWEEFEDSVRFRNATGVTGNGDRTV